MKLPSGYSTYDYSKTPEHKGWGKGWPTCNAGPSVTIRLKLSGTVITQIHRDIAELLAIIMNEIENRGFLFYNPGTWGGACRAIAGTRVSSNHTWRLAVDMNAPDNPYTWSNVRTIPDWAFAMFRAHGFGLGADYKGKKDWMHAEFMGTPNDARVMTELARNNYMKERDDMAQVDQAEWNKVVSQVKFLYDAMLYEEGGFGFVEANSHKLDKANESLKDIQTRLRVPGYPFDFLPHIVNQNNAMAAQLAAVQATKEDGGVDVQALAEKLGDILPDEIRKSLGEALMK